MKTENNIIQNIEKSFNVKFKTNTLKRKTIFMNNRIFNNYFLFFNSISNYKSYDITINQYKRFIETLKINTNWKQQPLNFTIKPLLFNISYEKDLNKYTFLNKKQNFKDISILQILKILLKKHKISKSQYKHSIQNLNNGLKLKNSILELINIYYKHINTKSFNKVITKYTKESILIKHNNLNYKVNLKTYYSKSLNRIKESNFLREETKINHIQNINNTIEEEFKTKMKANNNIKML